MNQQNPYRTGYCDAVMGRGCKSPWKEFNKSSKYVAGFIDGKEVCKKMGIVHTEIKEEIWV